jgi:hypothetical protein
MEVHVDDAALVAAHGAASAGLRDQDAPDLLFPACYGFPDAAAAPPHMPAAPSEAVVKNVPMALADAHVLRSFHCGSGPTRVDHVGDDWAVALV